jgi:hypothetical protein
LVMEHLHRSAARPDTDGMGIGMGGTERVGIRSEMASGSWRHDEALRGVHTLWILCRPRQPAFMPKQ